MRTLNQLLGTPDSSKMDGGGTTISQLSEVVFESATSIDSAEWVQYSTCRGNLPEESYARLIDIVSDVSGKWSEDERGDVVNDGLWDWLCHQYTFYSVTPLFLDLLLRRFAMSDITNPDLRRFVELCQKLGTRAIYLSAHEIDENQKGLLPIYRIEDVLSRHHVIE